MFSNQPHEDLLRCPLPPRPTAVDRRWKPNVEIAPNCPRCNSSNTKFCYYNNYSLTQPRYFCKSCRRYWTKGGSLRNVPIGGGCRKNRRSRSVPIQTNTRGSGSGSGSGSSSGGEQPRSGVHGHQDCSNGNSSVGMNPDASTIDLAVVYAKYLNQQPESTHGAVMHDFATDFDPSFDILSVSDTTPDAHVQFSRLDEQCIIRNDGLPAPAAPEVFLGDLDLNFDEEQERNLMSQESTSYGLQPLLPLENMPIQDMYWSNSPVVGPNFAWQTTVVNEFESIDISGDQPPAVHSSCLDENWSSFDLSSFDAFNRP